MATIIAAGLPFAQVRDVSAHEKYMVRRAYNTRALGGSTGVQAAVIFDNTSGAWTSTN